MKIATGYFAKAQSYHDLGYALVSVARTRPWFLPKELLLWHLSRLAPTGEIIGAKDNPQVYSDMYYRDVLEKTSQGEVVSILERYAELSGKDKVVLMCYEAPCKFCHRHLIAHWLNSDVFRDVQEVDLRHMKEEGSLFEQKQQSNAHV